MSTRDGRVRGASYELVSAARELRVTQTPAERMLWNELRGRKLDGFKFRRQHPIGVYILDFVCVDDRLIIELDGSHHQLDEQYRYDRERTEYLEQYGYRVMRFENSAVFKDLAGVLDRIRAELRRTVDID